MRIAVCLKQVPAVDDEGTDMEHGFVIRTGRKRLNPFDAAALEAALRIKEICGGEVDCFSMGPGSAADALIEGLNTGADRAFLLTDPAFAGADTLATARTLAAGLRHALPYDLIVCGHRSTDGDTGQVGPSLASLLEISFAGRVETILEASVEALLLWQSTDGFRQKIKLEPPALISVKREFFVPRLPSLKLRLRKKNVYEFHLDDLPESDLNLYGSKGSATKIKKIYKPAPSKKGDIVRLDAANAASLILDKFGATMADENHA